MLPAELAKYKSLYLSTALEYVRTLESTLTVLTTDPQNTEAMETLHICAHSLKSQSMVMQYEQLGMICHELEVFFKERKAGQRVISKEEFTVLSDVVLQIKEALAQIAAEGTEKDMKEAAARLRKLMPLPGG